MDWKTYSRIKKLTPLKEVFSLFGSPKFKLGTRNTYYLGAGYLIGYSPRMFRVEDMKRVEYGDEGEYATNLYFFLNKQELETYFKFGQEHYEFEANTLGSPFDVLEGLSIGSTFEHVTKVLRLQSNIVYYQEGETKGFNNGSFTFQNNFVMWGNYNFLFFGKSKKTKLTAFQFTFQEDGVVG